MGENFLYSLFSLFGKTAVITGGSGTLGSTIAEGLGQAGANIAVCYHHNKPTKLIRELNKKNIESKEYFVDVTNIKSMFKCRNMILKDFKKIDILINSAGGNIKEAITTKEKTFIDLPEWALEDVIRLNLFGGAFLPTKVFAPKMLENKNGGSIINIVSMNTYRPLLHRPGYAAAKAAVGNFTQWLATHFALDCNNPMVRVNAIAPGFFLNKRNKFELINKEGVLTTRGKKIIENTPQGRFGDPKDLVGACIWLSSEASNFVTGVIIPVDGGFQAFSGL